MVVSRGVPDGRDARAPLNPKKFSRRRAWPGTGHREGGITHVDVIVGPLAEQLDVGDFRHVSRCSCAGKRDGSLLVEIPISPPKPNSPPSAN